MNKKTLFSPLFSRGGEERGWSSWGTAVRSPVGEGREGENGGPIPFCWVDGAMGRLSRSLWAKMNNLRSQNSEACNFFLFSNFLWYLHTSPSFSVLRLLPVLVDEFILNFSCTISSPF